MHDHDPIRLIGVIEDGIGVPRNDGTRSSALYAVPFRLSREPSLEWAELFCQVWDRPPRFTTMHRPGIASVYGNTLVLDGTTMEEVEKYHLDTLKIVIPSVNELVEEQERRQQEKVRRKCENTARHRAVVREVSARLRFE